ncbi:MAG: family 16 glycoside hydrolase, partial [Candidatus Angelobacter sp.]
NPSTGAAYALWMYPNEKIVRLFRTVGWNVDAGFTQIGQANFTFDATSFHTLKLSFRGSSIQVFVDGVSLLAATDTTLATGMVALDVSSQIVTFDNVLVSGSVTTADTMAVAPTSLAFAGQSGGTNPAAQTLALSSSGGVLSWTASTNAPWLTFSTTSGVTGNSLSVIPNTTGLSNGTYNSTIQIVSKGAQNSPISIPVTLVISAQPVILASSPGSLNFFGSTSLSPAPQNLGVTNGASGVLSWTGTSDSTWLSIAPTSGTAPTATAVTATTVGMAAGQYSGNINLSSAQAGNSPLAVPVSLHVGNLLFSDDFSSGNANNWLISPLGNGANWSVVNDAYTYNGGGATQTYTGDQAWTDYSFSADFKLLSTSNYPGGIRARLNLTTGAGYGVWFYPASGLIKLFAIGQWNIDSGSLSLVAQAPMTFDTNAHNIRIDMQGSTIRVFYDNAQVIQATDATFAAGGIGLDVSNQPIQYDNIKVISF